MLRNKTFLNVYAKTLSFGVRAIAYGFGIIGVLFIFFAAFDPDMRPWGFIVGLLGVAICVAAYLAKPIQGEDLAGMQDDAMGRSHVSQLRSDRREPKS